MMVILESEACLEIRFYAETANSGTRAALPSTDFIKLLIIIKRQASILHITSIRIKLAAFQNTDTYVIVLRHTVN